MEEGGFGEGASEVEFVAADGGGALEGGVDADGLFDVRGVGGQRVAEGKGGAGEFPVLTVVLTITADDPVGTVGIGMEVVVAEGVLDDHELHEADGHGQSESKDVDKGDQSVASKVADRDPYIAEQHVS